jgi:predicted ATPase
VWRALCGALAAPVGERRVAVPHAGRDVVARAACGRAARVSFADVCRGNWSAACYLALAAEFDVLLLDGVPALAAAGDDALRRFVLLVDVLYARGAVLVLAADAAAPWADVPQLFAGVGAGGGSARAAAAAAAAAAPAAPALRVVDAGGSSGRLTTMVSPTLEWSATGRIGASLADLAPGKFATFSASRCASRLHEMTRSEWAARSGGAAAGATSTALAAAAAALSRDPRGDRALAS